MFLSAVSEDKKQQKQVRKTP